MKRPGVTALKMLAEGAPPEQIIQLITDPENNKRRDNQQFGIINADGSTAGFTGSSCLSWAGHIAGDYVMVQGNILVGESVVKDSLAAFTAARQSGSDLSGALMQGLAAGSAAGGDRRAGDPSIAAMSAYLAVSQPDDPPGYASFAVIVPPLENGGNPVNELQRIFDERAGTESAMFFPSMSLLIILFIVLPALSGILMFPALSFLRRKTRAMPAIVGITSIFTAIAVQQIIIVILCRNGWALPVYGYFSRIYPVMLAVLLVLLYLLIFIFRKIITGRKTRQA